MNKQEDKRPYESPKLLRLGDVVELTQAVGAHAASDGGVLMGHTKSML